MGQYYKIVNLDKKQYLYPHAFDDGAKLMEFGQSAGGVLLGLTILLADGNNRGGGDCRSDDPLIGSWAGDRIVITGDYADDWKFVEGENKEGICVEQIVSRLKGDGKSQNLYSWAENNFDNISDKVIEVLEKANEWKSK